MIETTFFTDRIDLLCNITLSELSKDFIFQTETADSSHFNHTFNAIEKHLTSLYEKTRAMQDIISYLDEYIKSNVLEYTNACETILSQIEEDRDKLKQKTYMTLPVSFNTNANNKKDRNGKILSQCSIKNRKIMNYLKDTQLFDFSTVNKEKGFKCYNENLKDLLDKKPYRTFYVLNDPVIGGLTEQIKFSFDNSKLINMITADAVKCDIIDIEYTYQNTTEHEDGFYNLIKRTKEMDAISLTLKSTQYKEKIYLVDDLRKTSDCWDKIASTEYAAMNNASTMSQAEIDNLLGITKFKEEYQNYLNALASWKARREQVAELNRQNGYDDKVPIIDIMVAPSELGLNTALVSTGESGKITYVNQPIIMSSAQVNTSLAANTQQDYSSYSSINKLNEILPSSEKYRFQSITEAMANTQYGFIKNIPGKMPDTDTVSTILETSSYTIINKYRKE